MFLVKKSYKFLDCPQQEMFWSVDFFIFIIFPTINSVLPSWFAIWNVWSFKKRNYAVFNVFQIAWSTSGYLRLSSNGFKCMIFWRWRKKDITSLFLLDLLGKFFLALAVAFPNACFVVKEFFGDELGAGSDNVIFCFLVCSPFRSFNLYISCFSSEFFKSSRCLFFRSLSFLKYSSRFFDFKRSRYSFCLWAYLFPISYKKKQKTNFRKVQRKYFDKSWNVRNLFQHFGLLFEIWFPLFIFGINMKRPV